MKYCFSILVAAMLLFIASCTKSDLPNKSAINVTIISELTHEAIPNANVHVTVLSQKGVNGGYIYNEVLDSFTITSDANGKIPCPVKYNDDPDISVKFEKTDDSYSTGFLSQKTDFTISELKQSSRLTFYVRRYTPLVINVKSIAPVDDNDAVSVDVSQGGTDYITGFVESIQNFGVINQPFSFPATDNGTNPYWIGKNINSTIYGKLQEGTTYQISWDVRKNGVNTDYKSITFTTSVNSVNSYNIAY